MYNSTKEIQQVFSINIKEKNRTIPFVSLRCFYAEMRVEQLTGSITSRYRTIANEIGCNRDNLYNMLLKAKIIREDKNTKILFEAFKTKDRSLIEQYKEQYKEMRTNYKKVWDQNRSMSDYKPPTIVKKVTKFDKKKALISNLKLAEYLRKNKVMKHELWDTPVRNISPNQWQQVRSINEKMYDNFVNN